MKAMTKSEERRANGEERLLSQRMQIRHQIVELLLRKLLLETRHLRSPQQDDVRDAVVVCRHAVLHERVS